MSDRLQEALKELVCKWYDKTHIMTSNGWSEIHADELREIIVSNPPEAQAEGTHAGDPNVYSRVSITRKVVGKVIPIEEQVEDSHKSDEAGLRWHYFVCVNGHRNNHANLAPDGNKVCATPGCTSTAKVERKSDAMGLRAELTRYCASLDTHSPRQTVSSTKLKNKLRKMMFEISPECKSDEAGRMRDVLEKIIIMCRNNIHTYDKSTRIPEILEYALAATLKRYPPKGEEKKV